MNDDASVCLQALIDRIRQGDGSARRELLERACQRLRRLAARLLYGSFPALRARHDLDSVVHETWLRLAQALDRTDPPTVADFFRLAAHKVRQVLLDMAARHRRLQCREALGSGEYTADHGTAELVNNTYDPARLALWTEFHERVAALADDERAVFELHYYLGLPQAEVARVLGLHPRKVSYLWIAATDRLADGLPEAESVF
jgi:RNA polymerase sigma factor (sigma-70 family)